jgi:predicted methyltransferase
MKNYQITEWCHHFIRDHVKEGDFCIDATAGNGNDTQLLCELVGNTGKVLAFDVQEQAVSNTKERLQKLGLSERAEVILDSHANMEKYVKLETVSCIVFNFGYLPGGDHNLATRAESSIEAIHAGLKLLKKGGIMSLCIYSGGDSGFEEKDAILEFVQMLPSDVFHVVYTKMLNQQNNPPEVLWITKKN